MRKGVYQTLENRLADFWSRVDKINGPTHPKVGKCWTWTAGVGSSGYGRFWFNGKATNATCFIWESHNGEKKPDGLRVLHHCDNKLCVRPSHLFIGTDKDNVHDMMRKGRKAKQFGEDHHNCRLSAEKVIELRSLYVPHSRTFGASAMAARFGFSKKYIQDVISGRRRKNG